MRLSDWVLRAFVFLFFCCPGYSQETDSPRPVSPANESETPQTPEKVDVKPIARDDEIAVRLRSILQATGWFNEVHVKVDEGVVFLEGTADNEEHQVWAGNLAGKTQDVAAVVNRMGVAEKSIWDFRQAFKELREMRANAVQSLPFFLFGLVIFGLTWLIAHLVDRLSSRVLKRKIPNSLLRSVARQAILLPIFLFGIYLVLRVSGLTQLALTVLGGTGVAGLIIGIAFQDIAENFLASILISLQKPFRVGDLVLVDGHNGIVQSVTTRGTTLLTPEGNLVQIPNSKIYKQTIENYTANPLRRLSFDIGIGYDDSATQAQNVLLATLRQHTATVKEPKPKVLIDSLGAATVNLRAYFWIDGTQNDLLSVKSSCLRLCKQALTDTGISMPDEAREIIFPQGVPVQMMQLQNKQLSDNSPASEAHVNAEKQRILPASDNPREVALTDAEDHLEPEYNALQKQADQSWMPGKGEDLLSPGD